ncbi:hypothetical protein, partial [Flavobacterium chungangense]|uniref:hypothetical protein n=1 Tax=Flavobacterium chungangense TaxID=554283 RepID=UPI001C60ECE1
PYPSPDGRENPFVLGFKTKDLEGQREIAPKLESKTFSNCCSLSLDLKFQNSKGFEFDQSNKKHPHIL